MIDLHFRPAPLSRCVMPVHSGKGKDRRAPF
jgi:hypothetical protein